MTDTGTLVVLVSIPLGVLGLFVGAMVWRDRMYTRRKEAWKAIADRYGLSFEESSFAIQGQIELCGEARAFSMKLEESGYASDDTGGHRYRVDMQMGLPVELGLRIAPKGIVALETKTKTGIPSFDAVWEISDGHRACALSYLGESARQLLNELSTYDRRISIANGTLSCSFQDEFASFDEMHTLVEGAITLARLFWMEGKSRSERLMLHIAQDSAMAFRLKCLEALREDDPHGTWSKQEDHLQTIAALEASVQATGGLSEVEAKGGKLSHQSLH
jgi:hypothetical protein